MPNTHCPGPVLCLVAALVATATSAAVTVASAPDSARFAGATALLIQPENSYNGYDFSIQAALMRRGFVVTSGQPADLADAARLQAYDLVVTNIKRSFTPAQVAGLKAYLAAGGALYANWGGPMGCPELLQVCGVKSARSVYLHELTLPASPLTVGCGELRWVFPEFAGHVKLGEQGHEMVAFERTDGIETARDSQGRCLGTLREEGAGRCALLGFCPSNYRFVTVDSGQANAVLDNLLAWLLPRGSGPHPLPRTIQISLPRHVKVSAVSLNGRRLARPEIRPVGSLTTVTVPVGALAEGKTAVIRVAYDLTARGRNIETWIHDPIAASFNAFEPAGAADFLAAIHATVVQPLLRYEGGSTCYRRGIPGDEPRERFANYRGDLLAEYLKACHARGIKVIGGLYLDWQRFPTHLREAPPRVEKGQPPPAQELGQPVCPLDREVWEHNVGIVKNLLDNYRELDGLILDDNFEFDGNPCYCPACLGKFAAYCERHGRLDPQAEAEAGGAAWRAFWKGEKLAFCKRVHDVCAAHGKPVGGWTAQRGPLALKGVFDFAGDMVYVEPPCSVAPLLPLTGDFPVVTLLWGMNRKPAEVEADLMEAVRAGSNAVGFWIAYSRLEGITDNPWSLGSRPASDGFALTPGTITAIARAFADAERAWRDHYRNHLIQGDARFVVTNARFDTKALTVTVKRLSQPSPRRIVGPVNLSGLPTPKP
jgi:hypothetical protein